MIVAHATGGYSYQIISDFFGVYFTVVGKIVRDGRGLFEYDCRPDPIFFQEAVALAKAWVAHDLSQQLNVLHNAIKRFYKQHRFWEK